MNAMAEKARGFFDALPAPLRRHLFGGLAWLTIAGLVASFPAGVFYQQVKATGLKADKNAVAIEAVKEDISEIKADQSVLLERARDAAEDADAARKRESENQRATTRRLDQIIMQLSNPRGGPNR